MVIVDGRLFVDIKWKWSLKVESYSFMICNSCVIKCYENGMVIKCIVFIWLSV